MHKPYQGVITRFLRKDERFTLSDEEELPLVLEADGTVAPEFLQAFLSSNSRQLIDDMAKYGAVLLRGFDVATDEQFENIILSIPEFRGISDAFMSENGRTQVDGLKYVLHTNSVYKTGGTLYLGGFHTENYYSPDVPGYICFCCFQPSHAGGETGLINTAKIYAHLNPDLQKNLEKNTFFVSKWSFAEIAQRYHSSLDSIKKTCTRFNLPVAGEGDDQFMLMYKPSVLEHPLTKEKALQINLFEVAQLNKELRKCFMSDYQGKTWFWHRFFWRLPTVVFNSIEYLAVLFIAFFHSPSKAWTLVRTKLKNYKASKNSKLSTSNLAKAGTCFSEAEVKELAQSMRQFYSSCLWKKGDILLIDNKKVMHAGMPGMGPRLVRAMICNPLEMNYNPSEPGVLIARERDTDTIGSYLKDRA